MTLPPRPNVGAQHAIFHLKGNRRDDRRRRQKIFVAIPVHPHDLDFQIVISLSQAAAEAAQYNFKLQVRFRAGNSMVHKARNMLLSEFLATDCTDLFFVDSDISFGPGIFSRMVAHPVDFVCGCYRSKSQGVHYFVKPADGVFRRDPIHGLVEVEAAPGRFHARLAQGHRHHDRTWQPRCLVRRSHRGRQSVGRSRYHVASYGEDDIFGAYHR
jgi:hypothetical protein